METWIIYRFNPYGSPRFEVSELQAYDMITAINMSGFNYNEIICVKLKTFEHL